jgi:hypothetical protein
MSLYNLLFGVNSHAEILKMILGIDTVKMPDPPLEISTASESGGRYFDYEKVSEGGPLEEKSYDAYITHCVSVAAWPSGRFRDIHLNEDGSKIILYTRNGGGNREAYQWVFDILRKHPNYRTDYDDDYDQTYAYIEFKTPDIYNDLCEGLATGVAPETINTKFSDLINKIKSK